MELGGCISCGVQAYRTVISFLAIRMRSGVALRPHGSNPGLRWESGPRSSSRRGATAVAIHKLARCYPPCPLTGWLAGQRPCWLEDRLRLEGVRVLSVFIPMVCLILMFLG